MAYPPDPARPGGSEWTAPAEAIQHCLAVTHDRHTGPNPAAAEVSSRVPSTCRGPPFRVRSPLSEARHTPPAPATTPRAFPYDPARVKVIACATVIEEMTSYMPPEMTTEVLDFGLHLHPGDLTGALQSAIDASTEFETILLGYGLCSRAVVGLRATTAGLVIPRVDDCIAIFLGSCDAYREQAHKEPGTYYLTKGWIEVGDSPFQDEQRLAARYGAAKAERMVGLMLRNYTRLALINTGAADIDRYRDIARTAAERFGLRFEEIDGAPSLVEKLLFGPWDQECVVVPQGGVVVLEDFMTPMAGSLNAWP